jgi:SAM-dependent methyltransferase
LSGISLPNKPNEPNKPDKQDCWIARPDPRSRRTYNGRLDGVDVVAYPDFRGEFYDRFIRADLNSATPWVDDMRYDLVFAVEVIERLENPRSFCRLASRLLKAGGFLVITTPNPTSLSSLASLVICGNFREFRNGRGMYPAHITPLLPLDACRIMTECELEVQPVTYSHYGRIPFMSRSYQSLLPFLGGAFFSDNYRIIGRARNISADESSFITRTEQCGREIGPL